jgi:hypothetical protein
MDAAQLAAAIRRRVPATDPSLETDLALCEEAARGETASPREALRLIQLLHDRRKKLLAAAKPGGIAAQSENILSKPQERAL